MNKFFLISITLFYVGLNSTQAQTEAYEPRIVGDTLITANGHKIINRGKIKIGAGSAPSGDFKFIKMYDNRTVKVSSNEKDRSQLLPMSNSGSYFQVVGFLKNGSKKIGFIYKPLIKQAGFGLFTQYEVDIDNAIKSGEIEMPNIQNNSKDAKDQNSVKPNVTDELIKLKKLLDDGAITKEEYDALKKKVLNN